MAGAVLCLLCILLIRLNTPGSRATVTAETGGVEQGKGIIENREETTPGNIGSRRLQEGDDSRDVNYLGSKQRCKLKEIPHEPIHVP